MCTIYKILYVQSYNIYKRIINLTNKSSNNNIVIKNDKKNYYTTVKINFVL